MRADRLLSLVLLLQARGRTPAHRLARELGVSVRTVYRDLDALSSAGVPVVADPGPNGGVRLLDGYQFPLRGISASEADALLFLGGGSGLIYLDLPRWFTTREPVPHLWTVAEAVKRRCELKFTYRGKTRAAGPLGLVSKAGIWYLVVSRERGPAVFRVDRITAARVLDAPFTRPAGFDLAGFWARWSAEFEASLPSIEVRVRASPAALEAFGEVFGDGWKGTGPPDGDGWQEVTLAFEHERAAAHRLCGFGGQVEVLSPPSVRDEIIAAADGILARYGTPETTVTGSSRR